MLRQIVAEERVKQTGRANKYKTETISVAASLVSVRLELRTGGQRSSCNGQVLFEDSTDGGTGTGHRSPARVRW